MMHRKLTGLERHSHCAAVVDALDGLTAYEQIVVVIGLNVAMVGRPVAARRDPHATGFFACIREGEPERHYIVRVQPVIGGILMSGNELAVPGVFEPEGR